MELFGLDFIGKKVNMIFLGPPGGGKTHLATALAIKTCSCSICFTTMADLISKLKEDAESTSRGRGYAGSALVVVDEAGYKPISRLSRAATRGPAPSLRQTRASRNGRRCSGTR